MKLVGDDTVVLASLLVFIPNVKELHASLLFYFITDVLNVVLVKFGHLLVLNRH